MSDNLKRCMVTICSATMLTFMMYIRRKYRVVKKYKTSEGNGSTSITRKHLLRPYEYHMESDGKRLREKFADLVGLELGVERGQRDVVAGALSTLHNASLLIDDIEDRSVRRRGREAAYLRFGTPLTLNAANWKYFDALSDLLHMPNATRTQIVRITSVYCEEMRRAHRGQAMDIYWRDHSECPSEDAYVDMVSCKTTTLFRAAFLMLSAMAKPDPVRSLTKTWLDLIDLLGSFFQIRDDVANLILYAKDKGMCDDIAEGKFSYPVILCVSRQDEISSRLLNILQDKSKRTSERAKRDALECIIQSGALESSLQELRRIRKDVLNFYLGNRLLSARKDLRSFIEAFVEMQDVEAAAAAVST
jgi:geranylgeranyl diphosphate synthase, type III